MSGSRQTCHGPARLWCANQVTLAVQLRKMSKTITLPAELVTKRVAFWLVQRPKVSEQAL